MVGVVVDGGDDVVVGAAVVVGASVVGVVGVVEAVVGKGPEVGGGSLKITPGSPAVVGVGGAAVVVVSARAVVAGRGVLDVVATMPGVIGAAVAGRAAARTTVDGGSGTVPAAHGAVTAGRGAVAVASPGVGARRSRFAADTKAIMLMPAAANSSVLTRAARFLAYHHCRIRSAGRERWNAPVPMPARTLAIRAPLPVEPPLPGRLTSLRTSSWSTGSWGPLWWGGSSSAPPWSSAPAWSSPPPSWSVGSSGW